MLYLERQETTAKSLRPSRMASEPSFAHNSCRAWKTRSRDPKDDMFIAAALAGGAKYLVTNDRDLLVLGTPFGISIVTPVEFLRAIGD